MTIFLVIIFSLVLIVGTLVMLGAAWQMLGDGGDGLVYFGFMLLFYLMLVGVIVSTIYALITGKPA